jgi:hypothetical protein
MKRRIIKKILFGLLLVVVFLVGFVGGYCGYIVFNYDRIGSINLDVTSVSLIEELLVDHTYSATTYNIGFGAYSQDYTFFLDTGYDIDGNETC